MPDDKRLTSLDSTTGARVEYLGKGVDPKYRNIFVAWSGMVKWRPEQDADSSGALWY